MAGPHSPLTCVSLAEFGVNPGIMYDLIHLAPDASGTPQVQYDQTRINVMSTLPTDDTNKHRRVIQANTMQELEVAKQRLMSRPFLMVVAPTFSETKSYVIMRVTTTYRGKFALLVNPAHSMISSVIDAKFEQAKESILKGNKYCIELNFNPAIAQWYQDMVQSDDLCSGVTTATCKYGRVYITNHSTYQHIFDCHNCSLMCLCGLCWLSTAPCYMIYRHKTCDDFRYKFKETPVALRTTLPSGEAADIMEDDTIMVSRYIEPEPVIQTQPPPYQEIQQQQPQQPQQQQQLIQVPPPAYEA